MKHSVDNSLHHQLNKWIVFLFIEDIYNNRRLRSLPDIVAPDCQFSGEGTHYCTSRNELKAHLAYTQVNQDMLFADVTYHIEQIITNHDIVSVQLNRICRYKSGDKYGQIADQEKYHWEMFRVHDAKIVQRWTART